MQLLNLKNNCMATQHKKYEYKATKYFKTTVHYSLISQNLKPQLSSKLNISASRDFAKSKPLFWCQERIQNKWFKPNLTGLFPTNRENVYWGCRGRYQHLILFVFKDNQECLTVYYFENYFTRNLDLLIKNL
ncbi:hypothetical protein BTO16_14005 [Polaribacter glomeratus]|uniref:Uncharacterized protein n=2 Tax=Polaribacter glomeratus TaxID=102 RepID=A0A2S7WHA4_9FLAO|nr:hypothetical protein BTO16_14005 [Polaribacter glomeratus]